MQWQQADWSVTVGRQAVSWGSGIAFQPRISLTLCSHGSGSGLQKWRRPSLVERLLPNGHDLQVPHVMRRDERQQIRSRVSSTAAKAAWLPAQ